MTALAAGITASHPETVLADRVLDGRLAVGEDRYDLADYDRVILVGAGKAAGTAAAVLEEQLQDYLDTGLVVAPEPADTDVVEVHTAGHPIPDERGLQATEELVALLEAADAGTLVIAVITGGGSALLPAPADPVTLQDLEAVTEELLASGATIQEINTVRTHLSQMKGGRLAATAAPAEVVSLVFSDVVGDDPAVVASGPFSPDETTYHDAEAVLRRYDIDVPDAVATRVSRGVGGDLTETPGPGARVFETVSTHIIADAGTALRAARTTIEDHDHKAVVLGSRFEGEARDLGAFHATVAREVHTTGEPVAPPVALLSAGEATVTLDGDRGTGGPNQECALAAATRFATQGPGSHVVFGAVDTDGIDGNSDAAGALVDPETITDPGKAEAALRDHDVTPILSDVGALLVTGATGTNVNDLRILFVGD